MAKVTYSPIVTLQTYLSSRHAERSGNSIDSSNARPPLVASTTTAITTPPLSAELIFLAYHNQRGGAWALARVMASMGWACVRASAEGALEAVRGALLVPLAVAYVYSTGSRGYYGWGG